MDIGYLEACGCRCMPPNIGSRKRRRIVPTDFPDATARTVLLGVGPVLATPITSDSIQVNHVPVEEDIWAAHDSFYPDHNERLPLATHLSGIFPPIMLSSIVKKGARAEVEVVFPESPGKSRLKLSIYPHRIPYFAKEMFDVDADIQNTLMYLRLENGANAKVSEFNGAKPESLEKCFGKQIADGIQSNHIFSTEVKLGEVVTKCVTLEVKGDSRFSYSVYLWLDHEALSTITSRMWPAGR